MVKPSEVGDDGPDEGEEWGRLEQRPKGDMSDQIGRDDGQME